MSDVRYPTSLGHMPDVYLTAIGSDPTRIGFRFSGRSDHSSVMHVGLSLSHSLTVAQENKRRNNKISADSPLMKDIYKLCLHLNIFCAEFIFFFFFIREADRVDEEDSSNRNGKRQLKLSNLGFIESKRKSEEIESSGKGRCKFFQARKLEQLTQF